LRIAGFAFHLHLFLPDVMKDYQAKNPKVMVSLRSGNSMEVLKMVLEAEADIGIARSVNHPEVETMTVARRSAHPGEPSRTPGGAEEMGIARGN